ncbi:hypothetical protein PMKS-000361 [Pichia membranifaciens]|uniref:Uncharacterized protein n=1 Tax=Pichia membranifaciens TaxID=4926 RepID=A0A1Q2YBJ2_9ASCO|nr:hypothetical protein PMKS-000361 [Pichia membranifaciens]
MDGKNTTKHFFDHTLQTVIPSDVPSPQSDTPSCRSDTGIEKDHDQFLEFRNEIKSLFTDVTESSVFLLYKRFKSSPNLLQDAINAFLDNGNNISDEKWHREANKEENKLKQPREKENMPANKKVKYEYTSRKKQMEPNKKVEASKYFSGKAKKVSKARPTSNAIATIQTLSPNPLETSICDTGVIEEKHCWKKYIGTMNMSCWCTRSAYSLDSIYGDNNLIFTKPSGSNVVYVSHQAENSKFRRELGRLTEDLAEFVGPLIDESAIVFESKLFFVEGERLSTGDTFILRADCFISQQIFEIEKGGDNLNDDLDLEQLKVMKHAGGNIEAGTRLKSGILKLFQKLGLKSLKEQYSEQKKIDSLINSNSQDESEFQELHENAQLEELIIDSTDADQETNDGSEHENNKDDKANDLRLTMNQVKDLYRSTELNDLQQSLPESTPNNFKIDLRPYQKQGLSWMLQREKEYDLIGINSTAYTDDERSVIVEQLKSLENSLNPLWKEYQWPKPPVRLQNLDSPPNFPNNFYLNLYKGSCSLIRPLLKSTCKGGILADEMGLGKTITTLSLILSYPKDLTYDSLPLDDVNRNKDFASGTTLIVVPMALLTQWEREFMKVIDDQKKHRCFIYYGSESLGNLKQLLCGKDAPTVVLTTYGMIQSEWCRFNKSEVSSRNSGLFSIKFLRIILDEGHNIRNRTTKTAKAVYNLRSDRRWILTGTPIINRLEDLFSLVHFLDLKPWSYHSLWKQCISLPFDTGKEVDVAVELLKSILDPILLRRTKNQKDKDGNYLVILPPKEVTIERLSFNKRERAIYEWLKEKAVNSFNENFKSEMVFKNYSSILTQLLRLRQVCCHIDLIKTGESETMDDLTSSLAVDKQQPKLSTKADDEILSLVEMIETNEKQQKLPIEKIKELKEEIYKLYPTFEDTECSICTEMVNIDTCIITECKHCFCLSCLTEHFEFQLKHPKDNEETTTEEINNGIDDNKFLKAEEVFCPMCRTQINRNRLFRTVGKKRFTAVDMVNLDVNESLLTQKTNLVSSGSRDYFVRPFTPNEQSSKINALLIHLEQIKQESPGEHVIVFSQFTSFLDIIGNELEKYTEEFKVLKFDGRLNLEQRQHVLNEFDKNLPGGEEKVCILLLSLKAGGVGLNLTVASKAFLMDPHWNNAIEFQAIDRLHRVGQSKSVKVIRFIMEGSIEERMLAIQERKNQLGEALTISDEERRKRKLEELQSLFKE